MLILIRIYASLGTWPKMVFIVAKLQRADKAMFEANAEEIASYYYAASKHYLQVGLDDEAKKYLESALEYKPDYIEALNLFMELLTNANNSADLLKILKAAFSAKPCFEIARMFADSSRSSAEVIYGTLAGIAQPAKYPAVFLALAGYLGIKEKTIELKEPKSMSHDPASR
jgi:tetratricopeptide (TPR) repeat protein